MNLAFYVDQHDLLQTDLRSFDCEAKSLDAAIVSAVAAVRSTGVLIERVGLAHDELAGVSAAAAAEVATQTAPTSGYL